MTAPAITVNHLDLFPTRVWVVDLGVLDAHIPAWQAAIAARRAAQPLAAGRSNRLGWNSAPTLFDDAAFAPLHSAVRSVFDYVFNDMGPPHFPYALQAWANCHEAGAFNTLHHHAGALLSACYYLSVPEGSGPLVLRDARPGALLSPWNGSGRPNSGGEYRHDPQVGQLVIFPNWLEHGAEPHQGADTRVSIPINAVRAG
jgi:uncharacterized protein (TIGR02466 family)